MKYINYSKYKFFTFYVIGFIGITILIYFSTPFFFKYNEISEIIEKKISKDFNTTIYINKNIKYSFIPSPSIKIKNVKFLHNNKAIGSAKEVILYVPFKNLVNIEKLDFDKMKIKNLNIDLDTNQLSSYSDYINKFRSKPLSIDKGRINFYDKKKYISSLENIRFKYISNNTQQNAFLFGSFLNEAVSIKFKKNIKKSEKPDQVEIKFKNIGLKAFIRFFANKKIKEGNFQLSFLDNKIFAKYLYENGLVNIQKGNFKNNILDSKFNGELSLLPFFNFNLNLDVKKLNFNLLHNYFSKRESTKNTNIFELNNKINGNLNFNIENIYSKNKLIYSTEGSAEFINGDIIFHKFLINMGKLGASDLVGMISNKEKSNKIKFKQNIYLEDFGYLKRKFNVNTNIDLNNELLYLTGFFDLRKKKISLSELFFQKDLPEEEKKFIEENINSILFDNGYRSLFNFANSKIFVNTILDK